MAATLATETALDRAPKPKMSTFETVQLVGGWLVVGAVAIWMLWKLVQSPSQFFSSAIEGLANGTLYALIALGYTLVYGIIELINFAHGDLFMLGTIFSAWILTTVLNQSTVSLTGWLGLIATLVVVMALCAAINATIEFLAYRRLRRAPKLAPLITAVGMSFILQQFGLFLNGSTPKQHPSVLPDGGFTIGNVTVGWSFLIVIAFTVPILLAMTYLVQRTRQGKAMRATAQDQDAARLMGINVNRTISFTFALGGALAGAAGLMYEQTVGTTAFNLGQQLGLIAFTAAVLGGIGNLTGAVLGGVLIGLIQGLNDGLPLLGQRWSQSVVFTVLILLMVFKPEGILGRPTTEKV
jgi:branched-chain amino acid transport system permease protein